MLLATSVGSCRDGSSPGGPARIDYIAGAVEPILTRGERVVIEGFGFGTEPGSVLFTRIGGGIIQTAIADSDWTPFAVVVTVPDSTAPGHVALALATAAGNQIVATINVLPRSSFNPNALTWVARGTFPGAPSGVGVAAAEFPAAGGVLRTTLYAAGGAVPPQMTPDSGVYVARVTDGGGGAVGNWARQRDVLPAPRAFAATVVATRFNSRFRGSALYVIGGIDGAGRAQASVLGANMTADSVTSPFVTLEPLPTPLAGAIAVVRHGRIYVLGGADALGRPQHAVYMGRIGADGHIDGWYIQPPLAGPRAYGGGIARQTQVVAIGGVADSVPAGGGLGAGIQRLVTGDTAAVSVLSGFFTGAWGAGPALLPEGRSQFALFDLDSRVLVVGGMYAGAATNAAETLVASVTGDSVGPFSGPVGTNRIADLVCITDPAGTLVGPAGISWREPDGTHRGLLIGGLNLATQAPHRCAWGF